jgi:hypothetical protein
MTYEREQRLSRFLSFFAGARKESGRLGCARPGHGCPVPGRNRLQDSARRRDLPERARQPITVAPPRR